MRKVVDKDHVIKEVVATGRRHRFRFIKNKTLQWASFFCFWKELLEGTPESVKDNVFECFGCQM
jgi:hypothetical protein